MASLWPDGIPTFFLAHDGREAYFSSSTYNDEEVNLASSVVQEMKRRSLQANIVVLTPYRAQVRFLSRRFRGTRIRVCTVHAFQVNDHNIDLIRVIYLLLLFIIMIYFIDS